MQNLNELLLEFKDIIASAIVVIAGIGVTVKKFKGLKVWDTVDNLKKINETTKTLYKHILEDETVNLLQRINAGEIYIAAGGNGEGEELLKSLKQKVGK